jgi:hypothetical protein
MRLAPAGADHVCPRLMRDSGETPKFLERGNRLSKARRGIWLEE